MSAKRRWFQFHLLTAIVLMFVAGILIKLNLGELKSVFRGTFKTYRAFGWPYVAIRFADPSSPVKPMPILLVHPRLDEHFPVAKKSWADLGPSPSFQFQNFIPTPPYGPVSPRLYWQELLSDIAISFLILIGVGIGCECMLRWHWHAPYSVRSISPLADAV